MKVISELALLVLFTLFLQIWVSLVAARWMRAGKATWLRAVAAHLLGVVCGLAASGPLQTLSPGLTRVTLVGTLVIGILVHIAIVQHIMKLPSIWRAMVVWLISQVPSVAMIALMVLVVRPYVLETFVGSTNSMAPTILGWHRVKTCPKCGNESLIMSAPVPGRSDDRRGRLPESPIGICSRCMKTSEINNVDGQALIADRFVADKLKTPRRWDMVVFRQTQPPRVPYVKRLVGMPGEEVYLKDGAVWINGQRQTPPQEIAGIEFIVLRATDEGTEQHPWRLKADECIVLGDFSAQSLDSRITGPMPMAYIEGVVTVRYWPRSRWQVW